MPDKTPDTPVETPSTPQIDPNALMGAALAANDRASRAEARAAIAEDAARRAADSASRANAPKQVDPIDRLATEDITLTPDERKRLLGEAITGRARAIAGKVIEVVREDSARREQALENRLAMDGVMRQRPELNNPDAASDFAMAMTKAKFEFENAGVQFSSSQLADRAAAIYDKNFRKVEKPPFVEGAGQPNIGGLPPNYEFQSGPSKLEKTYGMKTGQIQELFDPNDPEAVRTMNNDYVKARNEPLLKVGVNTNLQEIIRGGEVG